MTTAVLGWDGLDYDLATRWDLADRFAPHHREIATIDNPILEKPHTEELWPAIITGTHPRETGIRAAGDEDGARWANPVVDATYAIATRLLPESARTALQRRLRDRGVALDAEGPATYADRGLSTMFDDRDAVPLAVPNYRTETDQALDLDYDRGAELSRYLTITTDDEGNARHEPSVPLPTLERRLAAEAARKLGVVETARHRDPDLIFVWLGYLDTVGHLAPTAEEGWQRQHYEQAARWTNNLRQALAPDDDLFVVADHGLQDGHHTHSTYFGATDAEALASVRSVLDVAGAIDECTDRTTAEGPARNGHPEATAVRQNLEDLGYI